MLYDNLSERERICLEDLWQMESLNIVKCDAYAEKCGDPKIKSTLVDVARAKRHHASRIRELLG